MKLSITSLFSDQIMSYLGAPDIIYSYMIDSFISEILKYESSVIESFTKKPYAILFTQHNMPNTINEIRLVLKKITRV